MNRQIQLGEGLDRLGRAGLLSLAPPDLGGVLAPGYAHIELGDPVARPLEGREPSQRSEIHLVLGAGVRDGHPDRIGVVYR